MVARNFGRISDRRRSMGSELTQRPSGRTASLWYPETDLRATVTQSVRGDPGMYGISTRRQVR